MKELLNRVFIVEAEEFKQKLGLPNGEVSGVEHNPDGSVTISLVGEKN